MNEEVVALSHFISVLAVNHSPIEKVIDLSLVYLSVLGVQFLFLLLGLEMSPIGVVIANSGIANQASFSFSLSYFDRPSSFFNLSRESMSRPLIIRGAVQAANRRQLAKSGSSTIPLVSGVPVPSKVVPADEPSSKKNTNHS